MKHLIKSLTLLMLILTSLALSSCALFPRESLPEQSAKPLEVLEPSLNQGAPSIHCLLYTSPSPRD